MCLEQVCSFVNVNLFSTFAPLSDVRLVTIVHNSIIDGKLKRFRGQVPRFCVLSSTYVKTTDNECQF